MGQFLRIRRLCSTVAEYRRHVVDLKLQLQVRGYPSKLIDIAYKRALNNHPEWWDGSGCQQEEATATFMGILPFMPNTMVVSKILRSHWHILMLH